MRCFIALCIPEDARAILGRAAAACRDELSSSFRARGLTPPKISWAPPKISWAPPKILWAKPEGYHLTLAFLGEIEGRALEAAEASLDAAEGAGAIDCRFAGLGGFPFGRSRRKDGARDAGPGDASTAGLRVLFAKIDENGKCAALCRAVNEALVERGRAAGLPRLSPEGPGSRTASSRSFAAHITLARAGAGSAIPAEIAGSRAGIELGGAWTIRRCALYKSELRSSGSVYTEIRGVELGGN